MASDTGIRPKFQLGRWLPIAAMMILIVVLGAYTNQKDSSFLSEFNLNGVMVATLPLALAAMGQTSALMVKAFDVSVGALITLCVVVSSFVLEEGESWPELCLGMLFVILIALGVGGVNVILIRWLKLSSIIATLATYSILQGVCLWLRPIPEGSISLDLVDVLLYSIGFMPVALVLTAIIAVLADVWLYRSPGGLAARAMGLDEEAAGRRGVRVAYLFIRAFFITAFAAALGGLFLMAQVQTGDPNAGFSFTLTSIAAAVLGGASLLGGRGSFIGAVVGALFLNVIINILPYLGWESAYGRIMVGLLTLVALSFYQAPELIRRAKTATANFRLFARQVGCTRRRGMMDPLQRLVAIQEISDLIGRYCMLFDDEDWAALDQLWTDDAAFVVEDAAFEGRTVLMDFLSNCLPSGYRTKHMISRPVVEIGADGTTARARTDVVWIAANFENTILGRYEDELVRDERGWRFARRVERPVQYVPGPPPMSDAANGVSGTTMRVGEEQE